MMHPTIRAAVVGMAILTVAAQAAVAQTSAGGISTQIPVGARAEGMGRSYSAIADDANATWWNPAGLGFLKGSNAALMHSRLVPSLANDVYFEYLAYTHEFEGWGSLGFSTAYLTYGETRAVDENGVDLGGFNSYEFVPEVTYGTRLTPNTAMGVGLKYIYVNLAPEWATGTGKPGTGKTFAADFGLLSHFALGERKWFPAMSVGFVLSNLGPNIAFIDEAQSDPIARTAKLGVAGTVYDLAPLQVNYSVDLDQPIVNYSFPFGFDDTIVWGAGVELTYNNLISGRLGYYDDSEGTIQDLTFGVGLSPIRGVRFDYASVPQSKFLDNARVDKFSLTASF